MLTYALLLAIAADGSADRPRRVTPPWYVDRPRVEVWTGRGDDVYQRGDAARVYFQADRDAFVTVFRVDTDGRVRVLFPREPWEDTYVRGGREYEIEGTSDGRAFRVDDYPGVGYVFAVIAADPFDYAGIVTNDHWDYRVIAEGRVRGDPYVALTDLATRIVPQAYEDWDYDIIEYHVERHYDYPRFACYNCHAYASWTYWDPYAHYCSRFRIVIYDDPWYYPYRTTYYGGTRVVITRPYRPAARFVFKETSGEARDRDPYVTRTRQREGEDRPREVRPRERDTGGLGVIPPPRRRDTAGDERSQVRDGGRDAPGSRDTEVDRRRDGGGTIDRRDRSQPAPRVQPDRVQADRSRTVTAPTQVEPRRTVTPAPRDESRDQPRGGAEPRRESTGSGRESGNSGQAQRNRDDGGSARPAPAREPARTQPRAGGNDGGGRSSPPAKAAPARRQPESSGGGASRGGGSKPAPKPELTRRRPN